MVRNNQLPEYQFHQGTNFYSYEFMGSHIMEYPSLKDGTMFRVYAPNAKFVHVVGDFNNWVKDDICEMNKITDNGIWELLLPNVKEGDLYKYLITASDDIETYISDPFAFYYQDSDKSEAIIWDINSYLWHDEFWQNYKLSTNCNELPLNIYELDLSSWRIDSDDKICSYKDIAPELIRYAKEHSYTHIEIMPIMEKPIYYTCEYQICGYFAPSKRFGEPEWLMYLIDECHQNGIGVILDWVPAYFSNNDNNELYEFGNTTNCMMAELGTYKFDYAKPEVLSFLISSAIFWLKMFHVDGLRINSIDSMLYLDKNKTNNDWTPNIYGGNENIEAIAFIKKLNDTIFNLYPHTLMIAEDHSVFPMVTKPISLGGLGFNFKWNTSWTNNILDYMSTDPFFRKNKHISLIQSLTYAFDENFILTLSHEDVINGKKSLISKMPGSYEEKFANVRTLLGYMMAYPGKKLNFMGYEIGQFSEWDNNTEIEWSLLNYEYHQKLNEYCKELNEFYLKTNEFWDNDSSNDSFKWISNDDYDQNIICFKRISIDNNEIVVIINFAPVTRFDYAIGAEKGQYKEIFNSDDVRFGGTGTNNKDIVYATNKPCHGYDFSIKLTIPPLSAIFLSRREEFKLNESGGKIYDIK